MKVVLILKLFFNFDFFKVEVESVTRGGFYTFNCGRWLATGEDDGEIMRELAAEGDGIKPAPGIFLIFIFRLKLSKDFVLESPPYSS